MFVIRCVSNCVLCVCVCVSGPRGLLLDLWTESVSRDLACLYGFEACSGVDGV